MIAKCGSRVRHHWAHASRRNCDPWWENETDWHREWKNRFPGECREVSHTSADGEVHRADIKTPTGIIIEVQHSPMTDDERESREAFYQNLVWILDGRPFRNNFHVGCMLPDPEDGRFDDIVWIQSPWSSDRLLPHDIEHKAPAFWRVSEAENEFPGLTKSNARTKIPPGRLIRLHFGREIKEAVKASYNAFHQFYWIRPRRAWLETKCPVYIDFGGEVLYEIAKYDDTGQLCVRIVSKRKLLHDVMVETRAEDIATRFYPIK